MTVRLGIDGRDCFAARPRGTGRTLAALLRYLAPHLADWSVTVYTNRNGTVPPPARLRWIDVPGDRFGLWDRVRLPAAALVDRLAVLHCPSQTAPPWLPCPLVLTVHDLIPLRVDDGWSRAEVDRFRRAVDRSVHQARRIITVSEFTKRDLLTTFPLAAGKVDVVHWGVEPAVEGAEPSVEELDELRSAGFDASCPFFFAFGGDAPRKNLPRILEAFALVARNNTDVQLVLAGLPAEATAGIRQRAHGLGVGQRVVTTGYLDDQMIHRLLRKADALVFVSLYEGFGLPILEAMALGTPVITSNVTSMPEIAGDAAVLVAPTDVPEIAAAMRTCHLDGRLRADLQARGIARAAKFSWSSAAAATVAVYRRAVAGR